MNNQAEYEQKKRECWKEFCKEHPLDATANGGVAFRFAFDRAYALGKQEKEADTVIQGWVEGLDKSLLKIFDWPNIAFYSILSNYYALLDYNPKSKYDVPLFFIDDQLNNS